MTNDIRNGSEEYRDGYRQAVEDLIGDGDYDERRDRLMWGAPGGRRFRALHAIRKEPLSIYRHGNALMILHAALQNHAIMIEMDCSEDFYDITLHAPYYSLDFR